MELSKMLAASCVFGENIGEKIIISLLDSHPNILEQYSEMTDEDLYTLIISVPGFAETRTKTVIKNIDWAKKWVNEMSFFTKYKYKNEVSGSLSGYSFVISGKLVGYGKNEVFAMIEAAGGKTMKNVCKPKEGLNQIVIIVGDGGSKKSKDAKKYGLTIYNQDDLMRMIKNGV
jgi:NAD-dependent DNA ligase